MDLLNQLTSRLQSYFQPKPIISPVPQNENLDNPALLNWYANDQSRVDAAKRGSLNNYMQPPAPTTAPTATPTPTTAPTMTPTPTAAPRKQPQKLDSYIPPTPTNIPSETDFVRNYLKNNPKSTLTALDLVHLYRQAVPSPTVTPTPSPVSKDEKSVTEKIKKGFSDYGNPPAATMAATFAREALKYPVLAKHPGLLPAMSLKETSGGKAQGVKNWFSWGIHDPTYKETNPEQVIKDVAQALGSDNSPSSHYYKKFRQTGDIMDMLNTYAPPTENDTALYHKQMLEWKKAFE
jgi:hypothetical protein